jgi:GNAT superfamily N-acetyltransferase
MASSTADVVARTTELRVLDHDHVRAATELLGRGFAEEPGNVALFPDPRVRRIMFEAAIDAILHETLPYGTVHAAVVDGDLAAVAVWQPPGVPAATLGGLGRKALGTLPHIPTVIRAMPHKATILLRTGREGAALIRARRRAVRRATEGTTWHLAFLATAPEHRGAGLARLLLDRQLRRCDEDGTAAWLETTDPVNPPIYERFGFETVLHVERAAWLPGFWVMRREPRG